MGYFLKCNKTLTICVFSCDFLWDLQFRCHHNAKLFARHWDVQEIKDVSLCNPHHTSHSSYFHHYDGGCSHCAIHLIVRENSANLVWMGCSNQYVFCLDRPPKVLLLCRSWGSCVSLRSQRLCQLEFWLLVGTTMLDRLWARGQTKCNTPLMLATSVFGRIHRRPCYVMAQPKSRLDIPWPNDAECMGHVWYHFSCWYPLLFDVESLAGCVGG